MFKNVGEKIKKVASWFFGVHTVLSALIGMAFIVVEGELAWVGLLIIAIGALISWVSSLFIYGFGEIVCNSEIIKNKPTINQRTNLSEQPFSSVVKEYMCNNCGKISTVKVSAAKVFCSACGNVMIEK